MAREGVDRTYPGFEPWKLHSQLNTYAFGQPGPVVASRVRVLAECEAKRRIIGYHAHYATSIREAVVADLTLRLLAIPYADHPDFQAEWRC